MEGLTPARFLAPATIFLAAALLFAIEPLIAKAILPWFGGSAAVWIACLLFFQTALLAGYLYAHLLATRLSPRWQKRVHISLLLASLAFLPILPAAYWKPGAAENPLALILGLLTCTIGLPFALLASTTPLLTSWNAQTRASPTRLYALSNLGSMLALLSYPVLIEPLLRTSLQGLIWSGLYVGFVALGILGALGITAAPQAVIADAAPPSRADRAFWFLLPLAASALLLAVTNHILRDIAAIPLLWIAPLALYLLSFVISFESPRWYYRPLWYSLFFYVAVAMIYVIAGLFLIAHFLYFLLFYAAGLFVCCMVCHGELASLKPAPRHLTAYYLTIAAGGACGGVLLAVIAPALLNADIDLAVILPLTVLLVMAAAFRRLPQWKPWSAALLAALIAVWLLDTGWMAHAEYRTLSDAKFQERNFYGELRVVDTGATRELRNGNILHGREFLDAARATLPITYYAPQSGLGLALAKLQKSGPLKVGVIGLGAGTIAAYGRAGDSYRFYEIDPAVSQIATGYFRYLALCRAAWSIVMGDARLSLEREPPQNFDLLAVDAFTSDSIPMHLLTRQAFALYARHLKPGGVLAVHVSNLYVDLAPVVALAAPGETARIVSIPEDPHNAIEASSWVLVSADPHFFDDLPQAQPVAIPASVTPWTDDYSNLWRSLR